MTTSYDTDPNTQTIAAGWASSELGQPEREVRTASPRPVRPNRSPHPKRSPPPGVGWSLPGSRAASPPAPCSRDVIHLHRLVTTHGRGTWTGSPARRRRRPKHRRAHSETRCVRAEYSSDRCHSCASCPAAHGRCRHTSPCVEGRHHRCRRRPDSGLPAAALKARATRPRGSGPRTAETAGLGRSEFQTTGTAGAPGFAARQVPGAAAAGPTAAETRNCRRSSRTSR